jgi:hypothetical protein
MKAKKLNKARGLKMTIGQEWAEMMAVCRNSVIDTATLDCVVTRSRQMIPAYRCQARPRQNGTLPLCRLMLAGGACSELDPWAGPEDIDIRE